MKLIAHMPHIPWPQHLQDLGDLGGHRPGAGDSMLLGQNAMRQKGGRTGNQYFQLAAKTHGSHQGTTSWREGGPITVQGFQNFFRNRRNIWL